MWSMRALPDRLRSSQILLYVTRSVPHTCRGVVVSGHLCRWSTHNICLHLPRSSLPSPTSLPHLPPLSTFPPPLSPLHHPPPAPFFPSPFTILPPSSLPCPLPFLQNTLCHCTFWHELPGRQLCTAANGRCCCRIGHLNHIHLQV